MAKKKAAEVKLEEKPQITTRGTPRVRKAEKTPMDRTGIGGAPIMLRQWHIDQFSRLIAAGNHFITACEYLGIKPAVAYRWKKLGSRLLKQLEDDIGSKVDAFEVAAKEAAKRKQANAKRRKPATDEPMDPTAVDSLAHVRGIGEGHKHWICVQFYDSVNKARGIAHVRAIANVVKAGSTDWRAAAWYLERSRPDRWGRRTAVEVSGKNGGPLKVEASAQSIEEAIEKMSPEQLAGLEVLLATVAASKAP